MRRGRWRGAILATGLLLTACSGADQPQTSSADAVVSEAETSLRDLRSGVMDLRFTAGGVQEDSPEVGFAMTGPFAVPEPGRLPTMDLTYTQIVGRKQADVRIVSMGERAFAEIDDQTIELPADQLEALRGGEDGAQGLETLGLGAWFVDPAVVHDGSRTRVAGELDLLAALRGLVSFTQTVGAENPLAGALDPTSTDAVQQAVRESTAELVMSGEQLERLAFDAVLRADADLPEELAGGRFVFSLQLRDHNQPVTVGATEPDSRP